MWDFMKKPKPLKPVCQMQPTHEAIKQLEEYRVYILKSINCVYEKILEELSVTDPESLATLHDVIAEYREVEKAIDEKLNLMDEKMKAFIETHGNNGSGATPIEYGLEFTYDANTYNISYHLTKKGAK